MTVTEGLFRIAGSQATKSKFLQKILIESLVFGANCANFANCATCFGTSSVIYHIVICMEFMLYLLT